MTFALTPRVIEKSCVTAPGVSVTRALFAESPGATTRSSTVRPLAIWAGILISYFPSLPAFAESSRSAIAIVAPG